MLSREHIVHWRRMVHLTQDVKSNLALTSSMAFKIVLEAFGMRRLL